MVAAILRATWPDLPIPLTTTRPWHDRTSRTAATKDSPTRSPMARTASASMRSTRWALSRTRSAVGGGFIAAEAWIGSGWRQRGDAAMMAQDYNKAPTPARDGQHAADRAAPSGRGGDDRHRLPLDQPAAGARLPDRRRGDRTLGAEPDSRYRGNPPPGRIRRRLPDVLDRPGVLAAAPVQHEAHRLRRGPGAGGAVAGDHRGGGGAVRPGLAGRFRPRRRAGDVLDGGAVEAPLRASRTRFQARPRGDRGAAVPGSRRRAAVDPGAGAVGPGRRTGRQPGAGAAQGRHRPRCRAVSRPAADAGLVLRRGPAQVVRTVRPKHPLHHPGTRLPDGAGRAVPGPGRLSRRHADLRDRV